MPNISIEQLYKDSCLLLGDKLLAHVVSIELANDLESTLLDVAGQLQRESLIPSSDLKDLRDCVVGSRATLLTGGEGQYWLLVMFFGLLIELGLLVESQSDQQNYEELRLVASLASLPQSSADTSSDVNKRYAYFVLKDLESFNFSLLGMSLTLGAIRCLGSVDELAGGGVCFIDTNHPDNPERLHSYIVLRQVGEGKAVYSPLSYSRVPDFGSVSDAVTMANDYRQFADVFMILSEYNECSNILDKYIRLYQVVEHLMVRVPLATLINRYHGSMISLRELRNLGEWDKKKEIDHLTKLLRDSKALAISTSTGAPTLEQSWKAAWSAWLAGHHHDQNYLNSLTEIINQLAGTSLTGTDVINPPEHAVLAGIVYGMRNATVHNKASDIHFSRQTLPEVVQDLLGEFLFGVMERLVYRLVGQPSGMATYAHLSLSLV